jgi:hypothetical protein
MYWDASRSTAALIMNGTLQHIGQDTFFYVKNSSAYTIPKGTCVRFAGTDGASGHLLILPFTANGAFPSTYFMGVTAEDIANGEFGQVMHFGELTGIDTTGYTAGSLLYASSTVAGAFQTTAPLAPNNIVLVAAAVNSKNNGAIVVRPTLGSNFSTNESVKLTSVANGDLLQYTMTGLVGVWENKTLAQVIGTAYVPSTRTITINGTTQDLSANRTFNVGTVTSVGLSSATSGVTIGSTPVTTSGTITLAIATASGSQNGLLSSTDWTTFNSKQNALTNPVTGTGTTNYLPKFTGASTIGNSQIFDNGTGVGINNTSPIYILDAYSTGTGTARIRIQGTTNFALTQAQNSSGVLYMGIDSSSADGFGLGNYSRVIYSNNAYPLVFAVNDAERFRISPTGFVSAGATTNGRLGVRGFTNDSSGYAFEAANASGNTLFIVRNDGISTFSSNVGIGTFSPSAPLHIVTPTGVNFQNAIRFEKAGGFGEVNLENYYTSGSNYGFGIDVAGTTMMVVNNLGNVGIGTTSAGVRLVNSGATLASLPTLGSGTIGANAILSANGLYGLYTGVSGEGHVWQQVQRNDANSAVYPLVLQPSGGNVLIGTTTDNGSRLNVNGTIRTANPTGSTSDGWLLGRALVSGSSTPDRWIRVQIGSLYYDILARYIGSV